jgi:hypothetical protein
MKRSWFLSAVLRVNRLTTSGIVHRLSYRSRTKYISIFNKLISDISTYGVCIWNKTVAIEFDCRTILFSLKCIGSRLSKTSFAAGMERYESFQHNDQPVNLKAELRNRYKALIELIKKHLESNVHDPDMQPEIQCFRDETLSPQLATLNHTWGRLL